ncbi:hypothetical protein [Bacillus sp. ISL-4]|nr:hypothetical protein [Bacillus sp. ISL-4]
MAKNKKIYSGKKVQLLPVGLKPIMKNIQDCHCIEVMGLGIFSLT